MRITITNPSELVAAVPHLIGHVPTDSAALIALSSGPHSRIDMPTTPDTRTQAVASIARVYNHHDVEQVALVCFTPHLAHVRDYLDALAGELTATVAVALHVHGATWTDLHTHAHGRVDNDATTRLAAASVYAGRAIPAASRAALAATLDTTNEAAETEAHLAAVDLPTDPADLTTMLNRDQRLTPSEVATVVSALTSTHHREYIVGRFTRESAPHALAQWSDIVRRTPHDYLPGACALLALNALLDGNGALAHIALDKIPEGQHTSLARLTQDLADSGIQPQKLADILNVFTT